MNTANSTDTIWKQGSCRCTGFHVLRMEQSSDKCLYTPACLLTLSNLRLPNIWMVNYRNNNGRLLHKSATNPLVGMLECTLWSFVSGICFPNPNMTSNAEEECSANI